MPILYIYYFIQNSYNLFNIFLYKIYNSPKVNPSHCFHKLKFFKNNVHEYQFNRILIYIIRINPP